MHPELKRSIEHWDGRLESLPHYRGCQVFPGEAGVMPMRCTCGVTILAQRRLLKLPPVLLDPNSMACQMRDPTHSPSSALETADR